MALRIESSWLSFKTSSFVLFASPFIRSSLPGILSARFWTIHSILSWGIARSLHQDQSKDISFFFMSFYHFNGKSVVPGGLENINATGLHRGSCFKTMFTRSGRVALFTKTARPRAHAPSLVVAIKKNLHFDIQNG